MMMMMMMNNTRASSSDTDNYSWEGSYPSARDCPNIQSLVNRMHGYRMMFMNFGRIL